MEVDDPVQHAFKQKIVFNQQGVVFGSECIDLLIGPGNDFGINGSANDAKAISVEIRGASVHGRCRGGLWIEGFAVEAAVRSDGNARHDRLREWGRLSGLPSAHAEKLTASQAFVATP